MRHMQAFVQVRANALIVYHLPTERHGRRHALPLPGTSTYTGKMTGHTRKRLLSALDILVQRSPTTTIFNPVSNTHHDFKMNFTTLTIASQTNLSVKECYDKLLREWLRHMKRKVGMADYVWKAEYQNRGQVHYHVATNTYLPWETVRWKWNQLQWRSGLLRDFRNTYGHTNPNSTDIHSMAKVDDCLSYIAKEMCKGTQNQKTTQGKIWDCSIELKRKRFTFEPTWENYELLDEAIQFGYAEKLETEHCTIVKMTDPKMIMSPAQTKEYFNHIT